MVKIFGGLIVLVVVAGFIFWSMQEENPESPRPMEVAQEQLREEGAGAIHSIKEAMGLGKAMQCTYAMDGENTDQAITSTVVVEGEKFQSTAVMKDMTVYALFDGENQYTWMSNSKQGMKLSKTCLEKMQETVKDLPTAPSSTPKPQDMQAEFDMAENVQCEEGGKLTLTLPTDVVFVDQCVMMEQSMKMLEQMKQMPENMTMPAMPNMAY